MKELKWYIDNDIPLARPQPANLRFIGGKQDDITVTLAQVFRNDHGANDYRRWLARLDPYFLSNKTIYTDQVPSNLGEGYRRAKIRSNDIAPGVSPILNADVVRGKV